MAQMTEFGKRVDLAQKQSGLTTAELARKMKIAPPQLFTLKHKTVKPRGNTLVRVAKALGKPVEFFSEASGVETPALAAGAIRAAAANKGSKSSALDFSVGSLKAYMVLEVDGQIVLKRQINRLPQDFEI